jgi:DNA-binding XRE family transcriptional regulator
MPRDNDQDGTPQGVFGAELRYYRERAGLSQTELAALVNVSHDVISKIETGERPRRRTSVDGWMTCRNWIREAGWRGYGRTCARG